MVKKDESNRKQNQIVSSSVAEFEDLTYEGLTTIVQTSNSLIAASICGEA